MSIAAVIVAAGASSRLGEPKQLVRLGNETLLERTVRVARDAGCSPIIVVLGSDYLQILTGCSLGDVVTVINDQWQEGMGSSIRWGVHACKNVAGKVDGAVILTCDQPAVTAEHLMRLMLKNEIKASRYAARNGVPAFFPNKHFDALMALKGDAGARELLKDARYEELANGELDVDTSDDLERARELFEQ
ncbi:nucleotidyltransferase family protein [Edaphobacter bradus]|uniref:nucleotidyltransferase family protein n=1 Tax=Edaphobacter bradus TaxID=2259016 RepID=UPI0021E01732|nr:nucleotidyltransferase family protein [Edaphobacter bradus]